MPRYFLDSSALVKAYRRETGTARVIELLQGSDAIFLSRLAHVEVSSAIIRRGRAAGSTPEDLERVLTQLDQEIRDLFQVIDLTPAMFTDAVRLTRLHGLRAADSIQLASALFAGRQTPEPDLLFVGSDYELNGAAVSEGLSVLDPSVVSDERGDDAAKH